MFGIMKRIKRNSRRNKVKAMVLKKRGVRLSQNQLSLLSDIDVDGILELGYLLNHHYETMGIGYETPPNEPLREDPFPATDVNAVISADEAQIERESAEVFAGIARRNMESYEDEKPDYNDTVVNFEKPKAAPEPVERHPEPEPEPASSRSSWGTSSSWDTGSSSSDSSSDYSSDSGSSSGDD